jgi:type I restriction enzyme, R subunit
MKLKRKHKNKLIKFLWSDRTPAKLEDVKERSATGINPSGCWTTFNGQLNDYIENVRKEHEQIIDHINIDTVTKSEWDLFSTLKRQRNH